MAPTSQVMLLALPHIYPPPQPMDWEIKPIPRSLHHQSPRTPTRSSYTLLHPQSPQTPTQAPCTLPDTPTATPDNQLVLTTRPSNSIRLGRRLSDAEDSFTPAKGRIRDLLGVHQTTKVVEVRYLNISVWQLLTSNRHL